jgi:hypothetical protein
MTRSYLLKSEQIVSQVDEQNNNYINDDISQYFSVTADFFFKTFLSSWVSETDHGEVIFSEMVFELILKNYLVLRHFKLTVLYSHHQIPLWWIHYGRQVQYITHIDLGEKRAHKNCMVQFRCSEIGQSYKD